MHLPAQQANQAHGDCTHHKNPAAFDWKNVNVKAREYERSIRTRELLSDEALAAQQRTHLKTQRREYEEMWSGLRPQLVEAFKAHGEPPPPTFREGITRMQAGGNLIRNMGKLLYDRAGETDASEAAIKGFMEACPPFRSLVYAMLLSWYDRAVSDEKGERFEAGRNDLFMGAALPGRRRDQVGCVRRNGGGNSSSRDHHQDVR